MLKITKSDQKLVILCEIVAKFWNFGVEIMNVCPNWLLWDEFDVKYATILDIIYLYTILLHHRHLSSTLPCPV